MTRPSAAPVILLKLALPACALFFVLAPLIPDEALIARDPASGAYMMIHRSHGLRIPFHLLWGSLGWERIPLGMRLAAALTVAGLALWPARACPLPSPLPPRRAPSRREKLLLALGALAAAPLFWLLRVDPAINRQFGDAPALMPQIRDALHVFPSEVLTMHLFNTIGNLIELLSGDPWPELTIALAVCGTGAVFVWACGWLALTWGRGRAQKLHLFAGIAMTGATLQFFNYVETTFLVLAALALFFAAATGLLLAGDLPARRRRLLGGYGALSLAILAHGGGVVLLPATLLLILSLEPARAGLARLRSLLDPWAVAGFVLIVLLPWYLLVARPFLLAGNFGNMGGGADDFNFVPWDIAAAREVSRHVYYAMISWWHLLDIGSGLLIAAPLAPVFLICAAWMLRGARLDRPDRELLAIAATAALSAASIPLLWDFDFGGWGDWNILATYLFPLNVFAWLALLTASERRSETRQAFAPALLIQILFALGIALQFY